MISWMFQEVCADQDRTTERRTKDKSVQQPFTKHKVRVKLYTGDKARATVLPWEVNALETPLVRKGSGALMDGSVGSGVEATGEKGVS
jgi:hypothetical protein